MKGDSTLPKNTFSLAPFIMSLNKKVDIEIFKLVRGYISLLRSDISDGLVKVLKRLYR